MKKNTIFVVMLFCMFANAQQDLPKVAVYVTGGKTANENRMLGAQITHALVNSGRFMTIERADAFLAQVAREHVTQRSGAVDDSQISRLGEQAGAQFVCIVEIVEAFNRQQISARIVDVRTVAITQSGIASGRLGGDVMELIDNVVATLLGTSDGNQQTQQTQQTSSPSRPQMQTTTPAPARTQQYATPTQTPQTPPHLNPNIRYVTFTDSRDGQTYRTVRMPDGKTWMAENLNYRNSAWQHNDVLGKVNNRVRGSWCYNNAADSCAKYGRLYSWNVAMEACPAGWRLPTRNDWETLINAVGGGEIAGTRLRSRFVWDKPFGWDNVRFVMGTDDYGFSALPSGARRIKPLVRGFDTWFWGNPETSYFWSATDESGREAHALRISSGSYFGTPSLSFNRSPKGEALSVRCIQD